MLAEDEALQEKVKAMIADGVILEACIACSNGLGVTEELKALGIDVKGMGVPLTVLPEERIPCADLLIFLPFCPFQSNGLIIGRVYETIIE